MFDLVTKTYLESRLNLLKMELERDFHKALNAHSWAIVGAVTAVVKGGSRREGK
jgi:hypothetical protein